MSFIYRDFFPKRVETYIGDNWYSDSFKEMHKIMWRVKKINFQFSGTYKDESSVDQTFDISGIADARIRSTGIINPIENQVEILNVPSWNGFYQLEYPLDSFRLLFANNFAYNEATDLYYASSYPVVRLVIAGEFSTFQWLEDDPVIGTVNFLGQDLNLYSLVNGGNAGSFSVANGTVDIEEEWA